MHTDDTRRKCQKVIKILDFILFYFFCGAQRKSLQHEGLECFYKEF